MDDVLVEAASKNELEVVRHLLETGANINSNHSKGFNNWTALHWAACNGYNSIVSFLLLQPNIDIHIKDRSGRDACYYARTWNRCEALALIQHESQRCRQLHVSSKVIAASGQATDRLLQAEGATQLEKTLEFTKGQLKELTNLVSKLQAENSKLISENKSLIGQISTMQTCEVSSSPLKIVASTISTSTPLSNHDGEAGFQFEDSQILMGEGLICGLALKKSKWLGRKNMRYLVLNQKCLRYFEKPKSVDPYGENLKGEISDITGAQVETHGCVLTITSKDKKQTFTFEMNEKKDEAVTWARMLRHQGGCVLVTSSGSKNA